MPLNERVARACRPPGGYFFLPDFLPEEERDGGDRRVAPLDRARPEPLPRDERLALGVDRRWEDDARGERLLGRFDLPDARDGERLGVDALGRGTLRRDVLGRDGEREPLGERLRAAAEGRPEERLGLTLRALPLLLGPRDVLGRGVLARLRDVGPRGAALLLRGRALRRIWASR